MGGGDGLGVGVSSRHWEGGERDVEEEMTVARVGSVVTDLCGRARDG